MERHLDRRELAIAFQGSREFLHGHPGGRLKRLDWGLTPGDRRDRLVDLRGPRGVAAHVVHQEPSLGVVDAASLVIGVLGCR